MTTVSASAPSAVKPLHTLVAGRIRHVRRIDARDGGVRYISRIVMPAPDEFSHPQTVDVVSEARVGQPEEDVKLICHINSFRRTFEKKDGTPGDEIKLSLVAVM